MVWLTSAAIIIGGIVMAAAGFALAGGLLYVAATFTGKYAWRTWDNLAGIYKVEAMRYWFKRMHANGTHTLRKEHDDKLAARDA